MKIVICADQHREQGETGACISRSPYFVIADTDSDDVSAIRNPAVGADFRRGRVAAEIIIESGAKSVVGTHFGDKARRLLQRCGVTIYQVVPGKVSRIIADFKAGRLHSSRDITACAHENTRSEACLRR